MTIILLDIDETHRAKNQSAFEEVSARNAYVLCITDKLSSDSEDTLFIPKNQTFGGILANIYLQLLSYYLAVEKGYHPDFPRNLAKVVSVD